jgi:hypothetical protein
MFVFHPWISEIQGRLKYKAAQALALGLTKTQKKIKAHKASELVYVSYI